MKPGELDRILSDDDDIVPASGLVASVMDGVRREASVPPPIPFPWGRFAGGLVAVVGLAACLAWSGVTEPLWKTMLSLTPEEWASLMKQAGDAAEQTGAAWVVAALLVTLLSTRLVTRLASPRA
jgi:hypothetical protein